MSRLSRGIALAAAALASLGFAACDEPGWTTPPSSSAPGIAEYPQRAASPKPAPAPASAARSGVPSDASADPFGQFGMGLGDLGAPPEPPEPSPMEATPLPAGASAADREAAVLALLAGGEPATRLPIRAVEPGKSFDHGLRDRIAPRPKPPQVRVGAMVSNGGKLPPEVIQRIVRQNFGRFRLCYESSLRTSPSLNGRVAVSFVIDEKGDVQSIKDAGSDMPEKPVIDCVLKAFKGITFPAPEGGKVKVTYPISFSPGT